MRDSVVTTVMQVSRETGLIRTVTIDYAIRAAVREGWTEYAATDHLTHGHTIELAFVRLLPE